MTIDEIEKELRKEAQELVKQEPLSRLMLEEQVLNRKDFADMLAVTLACQLAGEVIDRAELERIFSELYAKHPELLDDAVHDLRATVLRDPACTGYLEPLLLFKGFQGLQATLPYIGGNGSAEGAGIIVDAYALDLHPLAVEGETFVGRELQRAQTHGHLGAIYLLVVGHQAHAYLI